MNLFRSETKKHNSKHSDNLLEDLPRGVEGRRKIDNWLPHQYFEHPDVIAKQAPFKAGTGDVFLGVVNGNTQKHLRKEGWHEYLTQGGNLIGSRDDRHLLTIAGSRCGKGRSGIIPNLLIYGGSVLSLDPKGENASITSKYRAEKLGQEVCVIDPFGITSEDAQKYVKRFNPLSILRYESETIVEDAGLIAGALIASDSKDRHWSDTAQAFLEGVILHVVTDDRYSEEERNLPMVADLIFCKRITIEKLIEEMFENGALENRVCAAASAYEEKSDNERLSMLSTVRRNIKFLDYDSIRWTLSDNEFEFEDLKRKSMSIYICLPVRRMSTCSALLRVVVSLTLSAMENETTKPKYPVLMILDEFPVLGYMPDLEMAIGYMAGFGVKLWIFLQDLSQLKALYEKRWETFIGNSGAIQAFGNTELSTTGFLSSKLGQTTLTVTNQNSVSKDHRNPPRSLVFHNITPSNKMYIGAIQAFGNTELSTTGFLSSKLGQTTLTVTNQNSVSKDQRNQQGATGLNYQQQVQNLLSPEEISQYFSRDDHMCRQLILQSGKRPWILQRACYDWHEGLQPKNG